MVELSLALAAAVEGPVFRDQSAVRTDISPENGLIVDTRSFSALAEGCSRGASGDPGSAEQSETREGSCPVSS